MQSISISKLFFLFNQILQLKPITLIQFKIILRSFNELKEHFRYVRVTINEWMIIMS